MSTPVEQTLTKVELDLVDPSRLFEQLERRVDALSLHSSEQIPLQITWWDKRKAKYHDRGILTKGRYDLTQTVEWFPFLTRDVRLGTIFVEKGIIPGSCSDPDSDGYYEKISLQTRRSLTLKSGVNIPPTRVDIIVNGVPEGHSSIHYKAPERNDRHSNLVEVLRTEWFLTSYLRKSLKEQDQEKNLLL